MLWPTADRITGILVKLIQMYLFEESVLKVVFRITQIIDFSFHKWSVMKRNLVTNLLLLSVLLIIF